MSFLIQPPIPERLNRCQLFGPGSRPELFEKMASSKADVINLIGSPLVTEDSDNLWIYRMEKEQGNITFKKSIYNKTLKLRFDENVLRSVEEINLN